MATSGSKNYAVTRADIIESALRKLGEYDIGEAPSADETSAATMALELMVKGWAGRGIGIWLRQQMTVLLQKDQQKYVFGTDHITNSFVETTLSAAEALGQTVISVTSSAGMTAADFVGIRMNDGTTHWTTIVTVDSATQITITLATDDAANSGKKVYAYTTKSLRPQRLKYAFRRESNIDTDVDIIGEDDYFKLSTKGSDGPVTQIWYHATLAGNLYAWPVGGDQLILLADMLADDFDAAGNNPDFPIEWGETIVYGLADRMAPEYGLPRMERRELKIEAREMLEAMLDYDVEHASVIFGMT